jgi:hypothetical protein
MSQDAVSEVLRNVRLRGAVFYRVGCGGDWGAEVPPASAGGDDPGRSAALRTPSSHPRARVTGLGSRRTVNPARSRRATSSGDEWAQTSS